MRINKAIMIYYRKMGSRGFGPHGLSALTCRVFIVEGQSTWEEKYYLSNANPARVDLYISKGVLEGKRKLEKSF